MRQNCRYLWDTVLMSDHADNVIQGEQGVTLDLGVYVLALGTQCQQLDQVDVVDKGAGWVTQVMLRPHQLHKLLKGCLIIVEQQHFLSNIN